MRKAFIFSRLRGYIKSSVFLILFALICNAAFSQDTSDEWLQKKSRHFVVYYKKEVIPGYIKDVISKAEYYYKEILDILGFRRFDFWTWDNRCKIFLYLSQDEYYNDTEQPVWSGGGVVIGEREISTYIYGEDFLDSVLPHEMGHLVFREFIGEKRRLPLWLDEGVACLNEIKYKKERLKIAKSLVKSEMYMPFEVFNGINDPQTIILSRIFYSQSASMVNFLVQEFGSDSFFEFSRRIRDGQSWLEALEGVYKYKGIEELGQAWIESIKDED